MSIVSTVTLEPRKILLPPFPKKRFKVLYPDMPWTYKDLGKAGKRGASTQYQTMDLMDMINLPIEKIAAKDSCIFMWATDPLFKDALTLMKAWGYQYKRVAFVWIKMTKDMKKPRMNLGRTTRSNAEFVIYGTKGENLPILDHGVSQVVLTPQLRHSVKPLEVSDRIDRLLGTKLKKIELFARNVTNPKENWTYWGNQK